MRARDFIPEGAVHRDGIDVDHHEDAEQPNIMWIRASTHGRELGRVKFLKKGDRAVALDLAVKPEYRGQGIARIMYDYAKELGYRVLRSAEQTDAGAGFWDKYRGRTEVWEDGLNEINAAGELLVDPDFINRFTGAGWEIAGEGRDQIVLAKPGSNTVLKIVGSGSLPRQAEIRRYVEFFRAHQRNPHFPRVGPDRKLDWKGQNYYAYTQERLQGLPGDEAVLDYLENFIGGYVRDPAVIKQDIPPGLTYDQVDGLTGAIDSMLGTGPGSGYDLGNVANIMQRANGQLVIVDPFSSFDDEGITEVKILSKVKGKGSEPSQLPRYGRPIEPEQQERYLGTEVGRLGRYSIWRDWLGGQLSYHLFDPQQRRVILTTFGSQYKGNPQSYIIHGLYAAPGNPVKAHQFYRALVRDQGITLISDRKQSPGGNRVWQQLEHYPDITVHGYDTRTGEVLNIRAQDQEMYAVPSQATVGSREMQKIARDIRLVAVAR